VEAALEARQLRVERIPQLVGMSAGAKLPSDELAQTLLERAKILADPKALAEKLTVDEALAARMAPLLSSVVLALARDVSLTCRERAGAWLAAAHQAEGRAGALEETSEGR
jgi:hypothetical protein